MARNYTIMSNWKVEKYLCPYCGEWHEWTKEQQRLSAYSDRHNVGTLECPYTRYLNHRPKYSFYFGDPAWEWFRCVIETTNFKIFDGGGFVKFRTPTMNNVIRIPSMKQKIIGQRVILTYDYKYLEELFYDEWKRLGVDTIKFGFEFRSPEHEGPTTEEIINSWNVKSYLCPYCGKWHELKKPRKLEDYQDNITVFKCLSCSHRGNNYSFGLLGDQIYYHSNGKICNVYDDITLNGSISIYDMDRDDEGDSHTFTFRKSFSAFPILRSWCRTHCLDRNFRNNEHCNLGSDFILDMKERTYITLGFKFERPKEN